MMHLQIIFAEAAAQIAASPKNEVMSWLDVLLFCLAVVGVIGLGIYKARPKKNAVPDGEK